MEHTDLGGSFVKPQSVKDTEVALEHDERGGGVVLSVGLKPKPVRRGRGGADGRRARL